MKNLIKFVFILSMLLFGVQQGNCQDIKFVEIYTDSQKSVSIYPGYLDEFDGHLIFSFCTKYLTPQRRESVKNAVRLKSIPYSESYLVIYDSTWTQYKILSMAFYNKDGAVIDSVDISENSLWRDVAVDNKEEMIKVQHAHKFASAIGRD